MHNRQDIIVTDKQKRDRFYAPPSILIEIAIPDKKVNEALRHMRILTEKMSLRYEIKLQRPDTKFPKSTFLAIMVSPNYKIKSAQALVKASIDMTTFQSMFSGLVFGQNNKNKIGVL